MMVQVAASIAAGVIADRESELLEASSATES